MLQQYGNWHGAQEAYGKKMMTIHNESLILIPVIVLLLCMGIYKNKQDTEIVVDMPEFEGMSQPD